MAEALYRKYRPQTFEDVVGQDHIERTLKNAIQTDKVSHAYLFTGPRGTGKTTTARLLAKALLCEKGPTPDPDGTCEDCELIAVGEHPDVYELDAASRTGVENVREEIIGRVNYAPTRGRYKVYIIDEVHMLSTAAFNALLKTLEEPPSHVVFVLCTTDPQKVPETIHSRCQRFDFHRIASEELIARLGAICELEGVEYEGDALDLIAHRAQGGMRDALTSLEQLIAFSDGNVTTLEAERLLGSLDSSDLSDIVRAIGTRDAAACFKWTSEYMETGADLAQFAQELASHIRNMYVMSLAGADVALELTEAGRREIESELAWFGPDRLARLLSVLGDLMSELKTSTNQRLSFEIALTRMVRPESDITLDALAERIEALEQGGLGAPAAASGTAAPATAAAPVAKVASEPTEVAPVVVQPVEAVADVPQSTPVPMEQVENAAVSVAPAASQPLGDMTKFWDAVRANLKKIAEPYGILFMNTRATLDASGEKLSIEFDAGNDFAFNTSQKPEVRDALMTALGQAGQPGLAFEITKASGSSSATGNANGTATNAQDCASAPSRAAETPTQPPTSAAATPAAASVAEPQDDYYGVPDDYVPVDDSFATGEPVAASQPDPQPQAPEPVPPAAEALEATEEPGAPEPSQTSVGEPSAHELNDVLASAFGDGIVFEEVQ